MEPKPVTINANPTKIKRWNTYRINSNNADGICTDVIYRKGEVACTFKYWNPSKNKYIRMLQFFWLKLKVHYS
jgi:hypothetical protein